MVRVYKRKKGARPYKDYSPTKLREAVKSVREQKMSLRTAAKLFKVPLQTIHSNLVAFKDNPNGGQTELNEFEEDMISETIATCADWGFPLTIKDVRYLVQSYLKSANIKSTRFKNNLPGYDWGRLFLARHPDLSQRLAENMKMARAEVSPEVIKRFSLNLEKILEGVPPSNILNYDESAFVDNPGKEKVLVRRGMKYPSLMREHSKVGVSVMMAGTASGDMLPPYVVYKSECLWTTWILNSVHGSRFNRTKSGWFDEVTFTDWFNKLALPYMKKLPGKKIMIGDNLASHLSFGVIKKCEQNDIHYVLLPPNSTHLLQPLDVAVFHPLKDAWRSVLQEFRHENKKAQFKDSFPTLLKNTLTSVGARCRANMIAGFKATGIFPYNLAKSLKRLELTPDRNKGKKSKTPSPAEKEQTIATFSGTLMEVLKKKRFGDDGPPKKTKRKKIQVSPGKSVLGIHFPEAQQIEEENEQSESENSDAADEPESLDNFASGVPDEIAEPEPGPSRVKILPKPKAKKCLLNDFANSCRQSATKKRPASVSVSQASSIPVKCPPSATNIKAGSFVIVGLPYSDGGKNYVRKYVAKVESVADDHVEVFYMRKYMNRPNEFVFITPDDQMPEEPEKISFSAVLELLNDPANIVRGRHTFVNMSTRL